MSGVVIAFAGIMLGIITAPFVGWLALVPILVGGFVGIIAMWAELS